MNSRNEDKLSMYEKVQLFLNNHISDISPTIPNTITAKTDFDQKIQDLMLTIANAGTQTTGYHANKGKCKATIREKFAKNY